MSDNHLLQIWSRRPNQTSGPTLTALAPLAFGSLSITEELSRYSELKCGVHLDRIFSDGQDELRDPYNFPAEITLDRNGKRIFAGPIWTTGLQGSTVNVQCRGLSAYLMYMGIDSNTGAKSYSGVDQHQIVKDLIDSWQNLDYGNFGIDTANISNGGQTRTVDYPLEEIHQVYKRIAELGARINGFDFAVDPATRELQLWTPERGVDRSNSVFFDARNVASNDEQRSVAAGQSASSVHAVSDGLISTQTDLDSMQVFGRAFFGTSERNITVQGSLDDKANQALNARKSMHYEPGPEMELAIDADWDDFSVGDTVELRYDSGLGELLLTPKIIRRTLKINTQGEETLSVELG